MHELAPIDIRRAQDNLSRIAKECFAGHAGLSHALHHYGMPTGSPVERFKDGAYIADNDLERSEVVDSLLRDIYSGLILYLHFGVVCSSW